MAYDTVIFDLDGTLFDTSEGVVESVEHTVATLGLRQMTPDEMLKFIGPPLRYSFKTFCGCDDQGAEEATQVFREFYQSGAMFHVRLYDGVREVFESLFADGIRIAVATSKLEQLAIKLLQEFGLLDYCACVCGADSGGRLSKSDIIGKCLDELSCQPRGAVMVGDTAHDAYGAVENGVPFLAVTYGFGFKCNNDANPYPHIGIASNPLAILDAVRS